jgi:predicted Rossmann fold nucleotide-binding protein DprA/Smf involved in DNA uptake
MTAYSPLQISPDNPRYPSKLKASPFYEAPKHLSAIGNLDLISQNLLGIFCSVRCPGNLILKLYDLAQSLRDRGVATVGGFHTPMEKEALDILLRGDQPVVVCPARSLNQMRVPKAWHAAIGENRLLVLSPFEDRFRRVTAVLAEKRNRFVAALAHELLIVHADPKGKTVEIAREAIVAGKTVYALESDANAHLFEMGAQVFE